MKNLVLASGVLVSMALGFSFNAEASVWNFECKGPGQMLHGAKYTELAGTIQIDFFSKATIDLTEKTLPPFTPDSWHIGDRDMPITRVAVDVVPYYEESQAWRLGMDRALGKGETENYYTIEFAVTDGGNSFTKDIPIPAGETQFQITTSVTSEGAAPKVTTYYIPCTPKQ